MSDAEMAEAAEEAEVLERQQTPGFAARWERTRLEFIQYLIGLEGRLVRQVRDRLQMPPLRESLIKLQSHPDHAHREETSSFGLERPMVDRGTPPTTRLRCSTRWQRLQKAHTLCMTADFHSRAAISASFRLMPQSVRTYSPIQCGHLRCLSCAQILRIPPDHSL